MNMTMVVMKLTRHITPWVTCENAQRLSTMKLNRSLHPRLLRVRWIASSPAPSHKPKQTPQSLMTPPTMDHDELSSLYKLSEFSQSYLKN